MVVKVNAVSLNFRDLMVTKGTYNPRLKLPMIPFSDGAGEITAVGDEVKSFKVGDRVRFQAEVRSGGKATVTSIEAVK